MIFFRIVFLFVCFLFSFGLFAAHNKVIASPKMDIVYTWVDSSDPLWQQQRAYYAKMQTGLCGDANAARRFRSRDELKYSLRSIYKFAPYFNKIFIVTNGQKPTWITSHPKIQFISHAQIFRDINHLPTFNSMAIESCLHRIPGLSDHFVYFNDDVFLGKPTTFATFFTKKDKIRVFVTEHAISRNPISRDDKTVGYRRAIRNTDELLSKTCSKEKRYHLAHAPDASRKSLSLSFEIQFYNVFLATEGHRFRCTQDYALTNGLIPYAAYYSGNAELESVSHKNIGLVGETKHDVKMLKKTLKAQPLFFCIQDLQEKENSKTDRALKRFFEKYFPTAAPWEK